MARRTAPPRWLWIFWTLLFLLVILVRWGIDLGDSGLTNAATGMLLVLATVISLFWFVLRSAHSAGRRYGTAVLLIVALVAFRYTFEVRNWSGSMLPQFGLRGGSSAVMLTESTHASVDLAATPYDFSGFLGSHRSLRVDNVSLADDWSTSPPELLWRQPIGAGWGGFAVVNGYAATLEEREGSELVTLYDATTGALIWSYELGGAFQHLLGGRGPRSTPLIHDGVVYAMGVRGHLVALDGATGAPLWERDILADYGISLAEEDGNVAYGRPTSPLVVDGKLVIGVGGSREHRVSAVAYEARQGEVVWEGGSRQVSMASPGYGVLGGREQILIVNENWVSGHDVLTGRVLWEFEWPGVTAADSNVSQAVAVPPNRVFVSKGYGSGAAVYELQPESGGTFTPQQVWHSSQVLRTKITNVAIKDGFVYGLSEGILECVDLATGERVWKAGRYHHGQILMVGNHLLVLSEEGELFLVEATPDRTNNVLGSLQAIEGQTWNTFALYGDVVLVRNATEAAAYQLPLANPLEPSAN